MTFNQGVRSSNLRWVTTRNGLTNRVLAVFHFQDPTASVLTRYEPLSKSIKKEGALPLPKSSTQPFQVDAVVTVKRDYKQTKTEYKSDSRRLSLNYISTEVRGATSEKTKREHLLPPLCRCSLLHLFFYRH